MKGSLKDLNEIPPCGLLDAFARNLETVPETLRETFIEGLRQRLPNGIRTQEQEQKAVSGNQEQKPAALRAASPLRGSEKKEGFEKRLVPIAREVLKLTNRAASIEHLYDAFRSYHLDDSPKADVIAAINVALSELRATS